MFPEIGDDLGVFGGDILGLAAIGGDIVYNYNKLDISIGLTPVPITIQVGNYNSTNLFSTITTAIFSITSQTFNFSVSKITGLITITSNTNFSLLSSSTINKILGFKESTTYNATLIGSLYTLNGVYPMNLLGTKKLQIRSSILSMNNYSSNNGGLNTLLTTIPVNASPFGLIDYTSISNSLITFSNTNLDEIDISISDAEDNNLINFNNQNWTLTLAIYEYKKIDFSINNSTLENSTEQLIRPKQILGKSMNQNSPILQRDRGVAGDSGISKASLPLERRKGFSKDNELQFLES